MTYTFTVTSRLVWLLFAMAALAAGLVLAVPYAQRLTEWYQVQAWAEVPCVLEPAAGHTRSSGPAAQAARPLDLAALSYRYTYDGHGYVGNRLAPAMPPAGSGRELDDGDSARMLSALGAALRQGGHFRCFVNPAQPGQAVLFREPRAGDLLQASLLPAVLPLAGAAIIYGMLAVRRRTRAVHALQSLHPGAPWLWRPECAGSRPVPPTNRPHPWAATVITAWFCLVWGPLLHLVLTQGGGPALGRSAQLTPSGPGLLPALPLLAALFLTTRSWWRHAGGWPLLLPIQPQPVLTGGHLAAEISLPDRPHRGGPTPPPPLLARLTCHAEYEERDTDGHTRTRRKLRWMAEQEVTQSHATAATAGRACAAVVFDIPAGLPAEDQVPIGTAEFDRLKWVWELELRTGQGRSWWGQKRWIFRLPVFSPHVPLKADLPESRAAAQARKEAVAAEDAASAAWALSQVNVAELRATLARQSIDIAFAADGQVPARLHLPARRFAQGRGLPLFFLLVWAAGTLALAVQPDVPFFIPLLTGALALFLLWLLGTLYRTRGAVLDEHGAELRWKLGPWGRTTRLHRQQISRFWVGRTPLRLGPARYHHIQAEMTDGQRVRVLDGLADSRAAECLVTLLEHWRRNA